MFLINIAFLNCSNKELVKDDSTDRIDVSVEQGDQNIAIVDDAVEIRRRNFSLVFRFKQPDSVLVNASFHPETFNNANEGLPLDELAGFKDTGITEELYNKNSALYISYKSPNYWYYVDDKDHRFTSVVKNENGFICTREITSFIDFDGSGDKNNIGNVMQKEFYLVIVKSEWNRDYTKRIEKSRRMIKFKFIL
ncbi:MAG: hypothetical protein FWF73_07935 [Spirochaetes bacterium]|nr:hypothetical protein [Spirochaetota bacterium]